MNCPKCGSPVGKNDEYCGSCGYHLNTSGEPEQKKKKPGLLIFTVVLEVIAIVAIVGAILFVVHGDKETEKGSGEVKIEETGSSESNKGSDGASSTEEQEEGDSSELGNQKETDDASKTENRKEADDSLNAENQEDSDNHPEPAPDDSTNQDTGAEAEKITYVKLLNDSDLLKDIKKSYTRVDSSAIINMNASSVIDQDLVENEPIKAFDDNDKTDWQEGANGPGIGEYLEFTFDKSYPIAYMTFKLGNWLSDDYYWGNYRPKTLRIDSGSDSWNLTFPDGKDEFLVELDPETDISDIKIMIQEVYTDQVKWDDTAITDIGLWYKAD